MNTGRRTFYILLQLLGALIWGLAFAFQSIGMENTGPFTFNAVRFMLATAVVFFFSVFTDTGRRIARKRSGESLPPEVNTEYSWKSAGLWKTGIIIGVLLSLAGNLQQIGILYTDSVGKAGFITAMYIVLVPVCGIFMKKKIRPVVWAGVALSVLGLYFLTMSGTFSFSKGDIFLMACAVMFTLQILVIDSEASKYDTIKLACIEFLQMAVGQFQQDRKHRCLYRVSYRFGHFGCGHVCRGKPGYEVGPGCVGSYSLHRNIFGRSRLYDPDRMPVQAGADHRIDTYEL